MGKGGEELTLTSVDNSPARCSSQHRMSAYLDEEECQLLNVRKGRNWFEGRAEGIGRT